MLAQLERSALSDRAALTQTAEQVTKYVEREILNHRVLMHPHIVQFKEARPSSTAAAGAAAGANML